MKAEEIENGRIVSIIGPIKQWIDTILIRDKKSLIVVRSNGGCNLNVGNIYDVDKWQNTEFRYVANCPEYIKK